MKQSQQRFPSSFDVIARLVQNHVLIFTLACTTLAAAEFGDRADKPGTQQKALVPNDLIPPSPALSPQEALKTFRLPEGLKMEVVASEPMVETPVAMNIDADGRLWVVEMRGYMPNLDGKGEDAPVGVVATLEDTDQDGIMDKRTIFLDQLILPRALLVTSKGVLVGAPPYLWFCRDNDGDGKCDEKIEIANDFGVQVDPSRPELANPQRAPNGLLWSLDNWIYAAGYTKRFRYLDGQWISAPTTFRGQWGLSENDQGQLFYNSNSDQLRADILPSSYLVRNPYLTPLTGNNVNLAKDQLVWPSRVTPGINRGYQPAMLTEDYKLKVFTAACSPWIYRADLLGSAYYGNAFVCEPAGNLVRRNLLSSHEGTFTATSAYEQDEFLTSTDERFRPVNLYTGPEGALYVVDMYRGVLEHRISLTSYLRKQSESRQLQTPINQGRIYRIVPKGFHSKSKPQPQMSKNQKGFELINHLAHSNSWWRMTAQQHLIERNDPSVAPLLKKLIRDSLNPLQRLHALWTLEGMGKLEIQDIIPSLQDTDAKVRHSAIRLTESFFKTPYRDQAITALSRLTHDSDPLVQQQMILTLSAAGDETIDLKIAEWIEQSPNTEYLPDAAISGMLGRELLLLRKLLKLSQWQEGKPHLIKFLARLTQSAFASSRQEDADQLLDLYLNQPAESPQSQAMLQGMLSTSAITSKKPVKLSRAPYFSNQNPTETDRNTAKHPKWDKLTALITWPDKPGAKLESPPIPLNAVQQAQFELGKTLYAGICAACHQSHGHGMDGLAPPLVDSEWVLGSEQRLVRILLHGLSGPIQVKGRTYNLDMPGFQFFSDEQLAALITYIRREWDHGADPVRPETVQIIRKATHPRQEPWRQQELIQFEDTKMPSSR